MMIWNAVPLPVSTLRTVDPELARLPPAPPPHVHGAFESTVATAFAASTVDVGATDDAEGDTE